MANFTGIVDIGGVELYVVRRGSGPSLLVIHGGPGWDHTCLRFFMRSLEPFADLIFFDLRGCGRSQRFPDGKDLHVDHAVEDLRKLMGTLELKSAALLDFSFGGRIGLEFISRYPGLVDGFVLASSTAYPSEARSDRVRTEAIGLKIDEIRQMAVESIEKDVWREEARRIARDVVAQVRFSADWPHSAHSAQPTSYPDRDYSKTLIQSAIPTLILHGEYDRQFPVRLAEQLASDVPTSRVTVIRNAGHLAHIDAPGEWNDSIRKFVGSR